MKHTPLTVLVLTLSVVFLAACAAPAAAPTAAATIAPTTVLTALPKATETSPAADVAYPPADPTTDAAHPAAVEGDMIQLALLPDQSKARYIITEQLAGNDLPNDVIGTTNQVSGVVFIAPDGTIDPTRSKFVIQAGTLVTDEARRDGYVRRNTLQADQYPEITFVPTKISGLSDPLSATGDVNFILTGLLTIRDVTKEVTWEVTGNIDGDTAKGTAKTALKFADFNLTQPRVPIVLSVEDNIRLEMDVTMQRAGK